MTDPFDDLDELDEDDPVVNDPEDDDEVLYPDAEPEDGTGDL